MKKILIFLVLFVIVLGACNSVKQDTDVKISVMEILGPEKVQFPSLDSLLIDALVYDIDMDAPVILLCHQARFNKFEYEGIAQKLNERGFNCIAIDQRSGGSIVTSVNETTLRAMDKNLPISYLDAEKDIIAAIKYVNKRYNKAVILWGSSYSSTLALYLGIERSDVSAVVSFSPGNYFKDEKGDLTSMMKSFKKPFFITSSKQEIKYVDELLENCELSQKQIHFKPEGDGHHGSRALWEKQTGGEEYWTAIDAFLVQLK